MNIIVVNQYLTEAPAGSDASLDNAVSAWKLTEASGTRSDSVGSNDLTDNNTVTQGTGNVYANCADFEASNTEFLSIADASQSGLAFTGDFSFIAWVKSESESLLNTIFSKWADAGTSNNQSYALYYYSVPDTFQWAVHNGGASGASTVDWSGTLSPGSWYCVYCYYDASESEIGISVNDGTIVTASHTGGVNDSARSFIIGAFDNVSGRQPYDGLIGPVIAFDAVLAAAEVTAWNDKDDSIYDDI